MKHLNFRTITATLALALLMALVPCLANAQVFPSSPISPRPLPGGEYKAILYNYGGQPSSIAPNPLYIETGNTTTGTTSITVRVNAFLTTLDGDVFMPFATNAPILVGGSTNQETVTPTSVSCSTPTLPDTCVITASFSNTHGKGEPIASGSFGLQEAMNRAAASGNGGVVKVDSAWAKAGGTTATIIAATPYQTVSIEDHRQGIQIFTPTQALATVLAAPATLTATTVGFGLNGADTTNGAYTGASTYHVCIAYVDVMGNEGPCSADFSALTAGSGTTNEIGIAAPAASTGAVGYTVYISLAGGTYNLTYQAPLVDGTNCTLTKVENVTPACAVTNSTYNQTGSNAVISALTVNTAPLHLLATTASTTSAYIGTPSGRTSYKYAAHTNSAASYGLTTSQQAYAIAPAAATTVPEVIGTTPIPIGFMSQVGRTLKICGQATEAAAGSTATVQNFEILWDAAGSNTAGAPVIVGQLQLTATLVTANADNWSFCWTGHTTATGTGVTDGSIMTIGGQLCSTYGAGVLGNCGVDVKAAAVGSLNLDGSGGNTQRIHVVWLHTTGTDANGITLNGLTAEVL